MGKVAWQKISRGNRNPLKFLGMLRGATSFYFLKAEDRIVRVEELPSGRFAVRRGSETQALKYVTGFKRAIAVAEEWILANATEAILRHNATSGNFTLADVKRIALELNSMDSKTGIS